MRSKPWLWLAALALLPATVAPVFGEPRPVGSEFRVNGNISSKQRNPVAAYNVAGGTLVVWENDQVGLRGRFLDLNGVPMGVELTLVANQKLNGLPAQGIEVMRKDPALAFLPSGEFLLAWTEERSKVSIDIFFESREVLDRDVHIQKFRANGTALDKPVRLNATAGGFQSLPKLLVRGGDQRALVVWQSVGDKAGGIYSRTIRTDTLQSVDTEKRLSTVAGPAANVAVAGDSTGNYVVAWEAKDSNGQGVFARLFDRTGIAKGGDFRVSTDVVGYQGRPAVASDRGGWLVTWQGQAGSIKDAHIFGQFLGATGNQVGPQFRISEGVGRAQIAPSVTPVANGHFLVTWLDKDDPFPLGLFGVEIDKLGNAVGAEVKINSLPINSHSRTSVASSAKSILIPWEGFSSGNRWPGISARRIEF